MANLKIIVDYNPVEWNNYLPPSIDQNNLNHLETNVELNRDTINEIIRNLGLVPAGGAGNNADIYNTPIYDTLIKFKNELARLEKDKLDKSEYNKNLGNIKNMQGGTDLVTAINNRLRRDIDDTAQHTYTFKRMVLTNGTSEALSVTGTAKVSGLITAQAGLTSAGKVNVTHADGIITTKLNASGAVTFASTLTVTGKISGASGLAVTGDSTVTGKFTSSTLVSNGTFSCGGNATFNANISATAGTITGKNVIGNDSVKANCQNGGDLQSAHNYIGLGNNSHKLWVQGARPSLGSGDVVLLSVS